LEKEKNMSTRSKATALIRREHSGLEGAEQRLKELGIKLPAPPEPFRHLCGSSSDGQTAFSDRHASYGRPRGEIHWARRRGARRGGGAQGGSPRCIQCPRCCEAAFGIARQSDSGRPAGSAILGGNP